jgi:hypothetical protein
MPTSTKCQKIEKKMAINVNENEKPTNPQFQKNWDNINIKRIIANDLIFNSPKVGTGCKETREKNYVGNISGNLQHL